MDEDLDYLTNKKDIDIYYRAINSDGKLRKTTLLGKSIMEESPRYVLKFLLSVDSVRKDWDSSFISGKVIENIEDNIMVLHFTHKISKKSMDAVLLFAWKEYEDGSILLMTYNIDHSKVNIPVESQMKETLTYLITPKKSTSGADYSEISWFVNLTQHNLSTASLKNQLELLFLSRFKHLSKFIFKNKSNKSSNTPKDGSPLLDSERLGKSNKVSISSPEGDESPVSGNSHTNIELEIIVHSKLTTIALPKSRKSRRADHSEKKSLKDQKRMSNESSKSKQKLLDRIRLSQENSE
jgi:hypothetical protein